MGGAGSTKRKLKLRYKLLLPVFGVLLALLVAEVGMRLAGVVLLRSEDAPVPAEQELAETTRVMAIGDSFTHGGLVERDETYPYYLQQRFSDWQESGGGSGRAMPDWLQPDTRVKVINKGVCDVTTHELLKLLPGWLDEYQPHVVLVLVGAANKFNSYDYHFYHRTGFGWALLEMVSDIRVIKLGYILWLNLVSSRNLADGLNPLLDFDNAHYEPKADSRWLRFKTSLEASPPVSDTTSACLAEAFAGGATDATLDACGGEASGGGDDPTVIMAAAQRLFEMDAMKGFANLMEQADLEYHAQDKLLNARAYYYREAADHARKQLRLDDSTALYVKAIAADPDEYYNYFHLIRGCDLQSAVTSTDIFRVLEDAAKREPALLNEKGFAWYYAYFRDKRLHERDIRAWTEDQLGEVIRLAREHGAKVVMQTYPITYPMANGVLRKLARGNNLPLVDHRAAFEPIEPKEKYLFDDDHCRAEGHQVMADNTFRLLTGE